MRGSLRWLYPGMRVKRWVLLSLFGMALFVIGLLVVIGKEQIGQIYYLFPRQAPANYVLVSLFLLLGSAAFAVGVSRLVKSIISAVAPKRDGKASDLIYRTRILERGPRVVAMGGGTGLSTLLRGLKETTSNITAIVTVMDDGGSSGRLRAELDVLPPGDVRNCVIALAENEQRMARLFQHRFRAETSDLAGHSLGNLLLVGMEQATGGFDRAIEEMSNILNIRGKVLPATLTKTHLQAQMEDDKWVEGETRITADPRRIKRMTLSAAEVHPYQRAIEAINQADLILLGPGSLFTSIIPNLLVDGIAEAIEKAAAEKLYVANLMTQPGETEGFTLMDHLDTLAEYVDLSKFDGIIVNTSMPERDLLTNYRKQSAGPIEDVIDEKNKYRMSVIRAKLLETIELEGKLTIKHDPRALAQVIAHSRAFSHTIAS